MRALAIIQCFCRSLQGELGSPGHVHRSIRQTLKESEGLYALEARQVQTICVLWDSLLIIDYFLCFCGSPQANLSSLRHMCKPMQEKMKAS